MKEQNCICDMNREFEADGHQYKTVPIENSDMLAVIMDDKHTARAPKAWLWNADFRENIINLFKKKGGVAGQ